jgi:hypothetical protein
MLPWDWYFNAEMSQYLNVELLSCSLLSVIVYSNRNSRYPLVY